MKIKVLITAFAILCLSVLPARAAMLSIDIDDTNLSYDLTGNVLGEKVGIVSLTELSDLDAKIGIPSIDDTSVYNATGTPTFDAQLDLYFSGSAENWSATGDLWVEDALTAGNRIIEADFVSTSIFMLTPPPGQEYELVIQGYLLTQTGNEAILVGASSGSDWVYSGEVDSFGGSGGSDTVDNQISISDWEYYDNGDLLVLHFNVPTTSLATFFSADGTGLDGEMKLTVVPAPVAVVLGFLGIGLAGLKLRKFA